MEVEVNVAPGPSLTPASSPSTCMRAGCTNPAVESTDWDKDYCSNECVATHCRYLTEQSCSLQTRPLTYSRSGHVINLCSNNKVNVTAVQPCVHCHMSKVEREN